jgi:hypothetical protein
LKATYFSVVVLLKLNKGLFILYSLRTYIASLLLIIYLFAQGIQAIATPSTVATGTHKIRKECKFKNAKKQKLAGHSWFAHQNRTDEASVPANAVVVPCGTDVTVLPYCYTYSLRNIPCRQTAYFPGIPTPYTAPNLLTDVGPPKLA